MRLRERLLPAVLELVLACIPDLLVRRGAGGPDETDSVEVGEKDPARVSPDELDADNEAL